MAKSKNKSKRIPKPLRAIDFKFYIGSPCLIYELPGSKHKCEPVPDRIEGIDMVANKVISERTNYDPIQVKPILKPLNTLTEADHDFLDESEPHALSLKEFRQHVKDSPFFNPREFAYLLDQNYDVFNWIKAGLAVQKKS